MVILGCEEGAQDSMAFPPPPWEAQLQDFSPSAESGSPFSTGVHPTQTAFTHAQPVNNNNLYPQIPQTRPPVNNSSPYAQMPQTDQAVNNNSPYPQMPQNGMYMPNQPNQALGSGYPPQQQKQQQMMMAQYYAQQQQLQQQQQQQQQAYGNQMGGYGYGYNQQQQGSSPYLDQQMYGLSLRDQTSHQVPPSSSMKPKNKPEDKLFGDLVDISKFKPIKLKKLVPCDKSSIHPSFISPILIS
ncbi:hypothetical protein ISN45_Aa07g007400 [Arabidopsis thaliana x Arabidopsis arenosa]|uniref:Uncharacterized protein n=1 Tax=Arabidopsis thaliana x Arabidopsis arenosa TaxID=1240361 RepID=A0A8T1Y2C7_9BRAS|nr:hypothetical protein ISN45_Aa07g007400 [Arabidopsis thaliana x Arabidopsis arenosa]